MADVLPGDIVTNIDGRPVWDDNSLGAAIDLAKDKTVDISINRSGQAIKKSVTIPAGNWTN